MYEPNTVLIAMYGATIGATTILKTSACTNQACAAFPPCNELLPEYLYYFLKSKKKKFVKDGVGGAQPNISAGYLKNIEIDLLSTNKQENIIKKLSMIENVIANKEKHLNLLDNLVKSRFTEMFGDIVSNSKKFETEKLGIVAPVENYKGLLPERPWLLNLDMIESNTGIILDKVYVEKNEVKSSTCTFDTNNVLYSKLRPYLNKVVLPDEVGYGTSELLPLLPNIEKINREYLAYSLRSDSFVSMISEKVAGAKMPRVSIKEFKEFDLPIPSLKTQNEFSLFVSQVDKSKVAIQKSIDELQTLYDSLTQKYFG